MSVFKIAEHHVADKLPELLTKVNVNDEVVSDTGSSSTLTAQESHEGGWTAAAALQKLANRTLTSVDQDFATDLAAIRRELNANYKPAENKGTR